MPTSRHASYGTMDVDPVAYQMSNTSEDETEFLFHDSQRVLKRQRFIVFCSLILSIVSMVLLIVASTQSVNQSAVVMNTVRKSNYDILNSINRDVPVGSMSQDVSSNRKELNSMVTDMYNSLLKSSYKKNTKHWSEGEIDAMIGSGGTYSPSEEPSQEPSQEPSEEPSQEPSDQPTEEPAALVLPVRKLSRSISEEDYQDQHPLVAQLHNTPASKFSVLTASGGSK